MRILIVIPNLTDPHTGTVGGAERNLVNIANYLVSRGIPTGIFTIYKNEYYSYVDPAVERFCCEARIDHRSGRSSRHSWIKNSSSLYSALRRYILNWKPDILLSFGFATDVLAFLEKMHFGKQLLWVTSERDYPEARSGMRQKCIGQMYRKADLLVCQSRPVYEYYRQIRKKTILPNVTDFSRLPVPVQEQLRDGQMEIVSAGRLVPQKNYALLLRAFAAARKRVKQPLCLSIYGAGEERAFLSRLAEKMDIAQYVRLPGYATDLHERIKTASIYVISSQYEGFSNAMTEALYLGLPVIATDHLPGVVKQTIDAESGIVVPSGDVQSLAGAIRTLVTDTGLRRKMRQHNSERRIRDEENDRAGEMWLQTLQEVYRQKRRR